MKIIMLGAPGSGRKTQAQLLAEKFNIIDISAGHLLRNAVKKKTVAGEKAKQLMHEGKLVPDELILEVLKKRLRKKDAAKGFVLNGYPNNISQAEGLEQLLTEIDQVVEYTFLLDVDDDTVIKRLTGRRSCSRCGIKINISFQPPSQAEVCDQCGGSLMQRADDNPRNIMEQIKNYNAQTLPLGEYYRQKNKNISINGNLEINAVFKKIMAELKKSLKKKAKKPTASKTAKKTPSKSGTKKLAKKTKKSRSETKKPY